jgi:hypothetical protein
VNKLARDETSCPLKKSVKGHYPGVVAIVGMPLLLVSYDRGRLAHDETPYSFMKKRFLLHFFFYLYFFCL